MSSLQRHRSTAVAGRYGVLDKTDKHPRPGEVLKQRVRLPVAQQRAATADALAQLSEAFRMGRRDALAKLSGAELRTMSTGESSRRGSPDNAILTKGDKI